MARTDGGIGEQATRRDGRFQHRAAGERHGGRDDAKGPQRAKRSVGPSITHWQTFVCGLCPALPRANSIQVDYRAGEDFATAGHLIGNRGAVPMNPR